MLKFTLTPTTKFYAPPDDDGAPSAVDLLPGPDDDSSSASTEPDVSTPGGTPQGSVPTQPPFDPAAFAAQLGQSLAAGMRPAVGAEPQPRQLTPEEAKKALNVWEPDDNYLQKFGNLETQKAALIELRDGLIRQMDTIAQMRLQEQRQALEQQYKPLQEYYQRAQSEALENRMFGAHPGLNSPTLTPIRNAVVQQLQAEGRKFDSEAQLFTEIATRVESVAKQFNPAFTLAGMATSTPQPSRKTPANGNGIPVTTPGAGGGGGGGNKGGDAGTGKSTALKFL